MSYIENHIQRQGDRPFEVNVEKPEKPVGPFAAEQAQTPAKAGKSQEAPQNHRDEKLDLWMENIKQFIRNIDVKSL